MLYGTSPTLIEWLLCHFQNELLCLSWAVQMQGSVNYNDKKPTRHSVMAVLLITEMIQTAGQQCCCNSMGSWYRLINKRSRMSSTPTKKKLDRVRVAVLGASNCGKTGNDASLLSIMLNVSFCGDKWAYHHWTDEDVGIISKHFAPSFHSQRCHSLLFLKKPPEMPQLKNVKKRHLYI